jgi:hypothetical protein
MSQNQPVFRVQVGPEFHLGKRKEILIPSVFHRPVGVAAPSGGEQTKGWIKVSASLNA